MAEGARNSPSPVYLLGLQLAGLIRMMDWEPDRPRRWPWQEIEDRDSDLAIAAWTSRVQEHLRTIVTQEERLRAYRRILVLGIGTNLSHRKSIADVDQILDLVEALVLHLQRRHPLVFDAVDVTVVRDVVECWESERRGKARIAQPDGSIATR